jgi:hypothetical protein
MQMGFYAIHWILAIILLLVLPEAATRKRTVSMRKYTDKTVSEQQATTANLLRF